MAPQMKGLQQFILDLRNAADPQEEQKRVNLEINNIQTKFSQSLNSYQKRKYMCKLVYIHMMGLTSEVQFGTKHAVELLSAPTYPEKSLGYFALSILSAKESKAHEFHLRDLISTTSTHLVRDLRANSEDSNMLALQFIASNFNFSNSARADLTMILDKASFQLWDELIDLVYSLCVSPVASVLVKKRAMTAFTVLVKMHPVVLVQNDNWLPRLLTLIDEEDPGMVLCAVPLVNLLVDFKPSLVKTTLPIVANRLSLLMQNYCPLEYFYHDVAAPWLVVKLLQLVENFFLVNPGSSAPLDVSIIDPKTVSNLRLVVSKAIENASNKTENAQRRNMNFAILFQAVAIVSFLDASHEAIDSAIKALVNLLFYPETNTRYLVLDALIKLSARSHQFSFREHLKSIFVTLQDKDVSVRKKALDLLYIVCDPETHIEIISKFLEYFPKAEASLRSDISVKIAVLAERYATDSMWYVSTMIRLLSVGGQSSKTGLADGGKFSAGEVWERIIQIIVNNEDLQRKSAKFVLTLMKAPGSGTPDNLIKVASFIIGEFGHTLTDEGEKNSQFSIESQVQMLFDCYFHSAILTRPMVMNAMLKVLSKFPNASFVPDIVDLFDAEKQSLDLEIQTRAFEYLKVATYLVGGHPDDVEFAKALIRPLPPFVTNRNNLVEQLGSINLANGRSMSTVNVSKIPKPAIGNLPNGSNASILSEESSDDSSLDPFGDKPTPIPHLSPNWYQGYHRMLQFDAGIFFEDQFIKMTYRISREGPSVGILFTVINKAPNKVADTPVIGFTVTDIHNLDMNDPKYLVSLTAVPESTFLDRTTFEISAKVRDIFENDLAPIMSFSYKFQGSFNSVNLKVPLVIIKTLSATAMSTSTDYKKRWTQIGELLPREKGEARGAISSQYKLNNSNVYSILQRLGFAIVQRTPDEGQAPFMILAAGILKMLKTNCGVLLSIKNADSSLKEFDIIVRSTGPGVAQIIYDTMREVLKPKH